MTVEEKLPPPVNNSLDIPCPCGSEECRPLYNTKLTMKDDKLGIKDIFNIFDRSTYPCNIMRADLAAKRAM